MTYITYVILLAIGLVAGVTSGLFGVGGGLIIVPALLLLLKIPVHTAMATSLIALLIPIGIGVSVYNYYQGGRLEPKHFVYGALICVGMIGGAFLGSKISLSLSDQTLQRGFAVFMVCMAVLTWWRA